MKKSICLAASLFALAINPFNQTSAQPARIISPMPPRDDLGRYVWVEPTNSLPKFDLNFPGGTPEQLVKAIEKETGKPLNAVIPDDCKDLKMPAFSVKNVTVAQVFKALEQVSQQTERFTVLDPRDRSIGGNGSDVYINTSHYGFQTEGAPTENSIWFFYWDKGKEHAPWQVLSSTVCKFYQLEPYLDAGYTVDDVTSAVETGWKMLGVTNPPAISYHKETKMLIAVGEEDKVNLIGDVLKQLSTEKPNDKPANGQTEKPGK
ncbi:MAG: hypothetical protein ACLPRE_05830 [Limisphaerales bacterium]